MDVHVADCVRRLQPGLHFAVTRLLPDADGSEIGRDVLVDLNTKGFAYPKASRTAKNEQHTLLRLLPFRESSHYF
jgi:hypothetical protein